MKNFFYITLVLLLSLSLSSCGLIPEEEGNDRVTVTAEESDYPDLTKEYGDGNHPSIFEGIDKDATSTAPSSCSAVSTALYDSGSSWLCFNSAGDTINFTLYKRNDVRDKRYCCELHINNERLFWNSEKGYDNCDAGIKAGIEEGGWQKVQGFECAQRFTPDYVAPSN